MIAEETPRVDKSQWIGPTLKQRLFQEREQTRSEVQNFVKQDIIIYSLVFIVSLFWDLIYGFIYKHHPLNPGMLQITAMAFSAFQLVRAWERLKKYSDER